GERVVQQLLACIAQGAQAGDVEPYVDRWHIAVAGFMHHTQTLAAAHHELRVGAGASVWTKYLRSSSPAMRKDASISRLARSCTAASPACGWLKASKVAPTPFCGRRSSTSSSGPGPTGSLRNS